MASEWITWWVWVSLSHSQVQLRDRVAVCFVLSYVDWWCQNYALSVVCRLGKQGHSVPKFPCWNTVFCIKQWQAVLVPLALTSLMYAGSLFLKSLLLFDFWRQHSFFGGEISVDSLRCAVTRFIDWLSEISSNVLTWRNYVVVSTVITIVLLWIFRQLHATKLLL